MYKEQEFLKHEKAACQKKPNTHSYIEYTGLLGSFSLVHTITLKFKACAPHLILGPDSLCTAINRPIPTSSS